MLAERPRWESALKTRSLERERAGSGPGGGGAGLCRAVELRSPLARDTAQGRADTPGTGWSPAHARRCRRQPTSDPDLGLGGGCPHFSRPMSEPPQPTREGELKQR